VQPTPVTVHDITEIGIGGEVLGFSDARFGVHGLDAFGAEPLGCGEASRGYREYEDSVAWSVVEFLLDGLEIGRPIIKLVGGKVYQWSIKSVPVQMAFKDFGIDALVGPGKAQDQTAGLLGEFPVIHIHIALGKPVDQ